MKGFFCNGKLDPFPKWICQRWKTIETRQRDMLHDLVGERVAVVETGLRQGPMVIGYVDVIGSFFCSAEQFDSYRRETMIPAGSPFDCKGSGKWFYQLANAEFCTPYPLPENTIRHGRSWCEF